VAPRAIQHTVDVLAWRFGETAPRAGGVNQTSDDGGTVTTADLAAFVALEGTVPPPQFRQPRSSTSSPDEFTTDRRNDSLPSNRSLTLIETSANFILSISLTKHYYR